MIAVQEVFADRDNAFAIDARLHVRAYLEKKPSLNKTIFEFEDDSVTKVDFAKSRYDNSFKQVRPILEFLSWRSLLIVLGKREIIIFGMDRKIRMEETTPLFRHINDDSGFYNEMFLECDASLAMIYEGGCLVISDEGKILWHKDKFWDDIFIKMEANHFILMQYSGAQYSLDCLTGSKSPIS